MSDITQGQDAKPPSDEKPDVDTLFGAKDVDDLFPADYKPTNQPVRNVSPIQDMLFSNPGRAHARILDAFGYGFAQDWGAGQKEFTEADEYLRKAGVYNDYAAGQRNIIKAANEAIMRPAVAAIVAAKSTLGGVFRGAQGAVAQAGEEYGAPNLAHELAAVPEAFPAGFHQPMGVPHVPHDIAHARSLDVIGEGEAGYFGTKPIEAEPAKEATQAAKVQDVAQPEDTPGAASEAPPSPVVQETAPQPEAPTQDIHAVARQIAPETFSEFDALAQKKDTFRRWIDELREVRDQTAQENAPHADAIAVLDDQIAAQQEKKGGHGKLVSLQGKRDALMAERDQYIAEHARGDSADMAKIRAQLMETDYRMRDLAPDVSKAYRDAEGRVPQQETANVASETGVENQPSPAEPQVAETGAEAVPSVAKVVEPNATPAAADSVRPEPVKETTPAPAALPIAHAPSIVADVSQKLKAAGRPAEEADAAAQIVAAYWETRAQRFEGAKGTAAEMYAAEGPEIKAGKEKSSKKARELELAQKGQTLNQSGNGTPRTVASTKLQEGFLRQEWQRNGPELDYEDLPNRIWNKEVAEWNKTHSTDIDRDHYRFGSHPDFEKHFDEKYLAGKKAPWPGVKQANEYFEDRGERGSAVYVEGKVPEEYQQDVKGRIRLREDGRSTITLMKNADASTFIHETGHEWLERMLDDARDTEAPQALRDDARTVLKWLGADSAAAVKTRHHEKFARGFETYMLEGRAPSNALARVFAKFKDWLTTIYRTAAALKAPISDEIRGVFDRMLAEKPEKTVIAPERRTDLGLAETHEGLAEHTPPHHGFKVAGEIRGERDSLATAHALEEDHARLEDARKGIGEHPPGGAESPGNANEAGALAGQAETAGRAGTERAGGGEVAEEGARSRKGAIGLNKAPTPLLNFIASRGGISASEELISDLRQALGGKNHYVPGYGQLIRTPKQISSSAKRAGRFAAMPLDRAREAAVEAGLLPETATVADMLNIIDDEVRGLAPKGERPIDPAEQAHAEHNFLEGLNDKLREAGGHELSDAERTRALELFHKEGLNDPSQIIERLALEQDDLEIERGAPERAEGIPGWDVAAPGWEAAFDDRGDASHPGGSPEGTQPLQPGGATARHGGAAEKLNPFDPNAPLPPSETRLIDKAGNIRLDNLGTPEDVNAVIRATADELAPYNEAITRGHIPDAEVVKLADALGMDASKLSERKLGEAFSAEQIVAARKLLIRSAQGVRDAMALAAEGDEAAVLAYAEAKSRHLMIQEHVSGITAEAGRALRAFRALEGQKDAAVITGFLQDTTGKTLYQLQREAQLGLKLETPQQVSKFVADSAKPTYKDMLIEAWMASLLSGARTHVANVLGNSIASIWHVVETATSAGISKVLGSEDGVLFGEAGAELFGMVQGSREGIAAGIKAFLTEDPQLTATRQAEKPQPKAIPGKFGEIVRTPMRLLGAEDEFFKAVAFRGDIYRQAYSMAAKEGLAPELMRQRTAELAMSPTDDMIASAKKVADYQTFQNALGKTGRAISAFSNSHALAKVVVPFVRTPLNLLKYAGERSPLGVFSQEVRDNLSGKNGVRARDTQIARIALGTMVGVTAFSYAAQGVITGGGPADKGKKAVMMANGWQPYSVKVGDMYYSYNRLDPFSVTLGVAADAYEIMTAFGAEHPDKEHLLSLTFAAITKNILNRTALQGISDLNQAASDPDRYFKNYVKGLAGSLVPAISAQSAQAIDPTVREARTIIDNFKARTPFLSQTLHPKRDIWGEPVVREGALGPDIASPIAEARLKNDPVNQALLNAGYYPATLPRKLNGIDLTDQQYDDYARIAGRMAKMRLNAFVNTPGISLMPKQVQADNMRDIVKASREFAQSMIMMQAHGSDNDIMVKASQAKTAKFKQTETVH